MDEEKRFFQASSFEEKPSRLPASSKHKPKVETAKRLNPKTQKTNPKSRNLKIHKGQCYHISCFKRKIKNVVLIKAV